MKLREDRVKLEENCYVSSLEQLKETLQMVSIILPSNILTPDTDIAPVCAH